MSQHTSSAPERRIVPGRDLIAPSFSCAFLDVARPFGLWIVLRNDEVRVLSLAEATERMAQITGYAVAYSAALVRKGLGRLWDIQGDGRLRLRSSDALRRQGFERTGIFKRSTFPVPLAVLGEPIDVLVAHLALPVMAGDSGCTSRAYTAGLLGAHPNTVSRWRAVLRAWGRLVTAPMYLRLGYVEVAKGGRIKEGPGGEGVFQYAHAWYRRGPDAVAILRPKKIRTEYCSLRSQEKNETQREGARQRDAGREELLSRLDLWNKLDNKFDGITHSILDLLTAYPADQGAPGPHLHAMLSAWEERVQKEVRQWAILSRSRLASVTDRGTGELAHGACYRLLIAELRRLRGVMYRCRARAGVVRDRLALAQNVETPMS